MISKPFVIGCDSDLHSQLFYGSIDGNPDALSYYDAATCSGVDTEDNFVDELEGLNQTESIGKHATFNTINVLTSGALAEHRNLPIKPIYCRVIKYDSKEEFDLDTLRIQQELLINEVSNFSTEVPKPISKSTEIKIKHIPYKGVENPFK